MTLVDFLLERIAEDEKLARDAIADDNGNDCGFSDEFDALTKPPSGVGYAKGGFGKACARIIVTMTPRRLLADVAAKRAIIEDHGWVYSDPYESWKDDAYRALHGDTRDQRDCIRCGGARPQALVGIVPEFVPWPCPTLKALAGVYADHPDYQESWKP